MQKKNWSDGGVPTVMGPGKFPRCPSNCRMDVVSTCSFTLCYQRNSSCYWT